MQQSYRYLKILLLCWASINFAQDVVTPHKEVLLDTGLTINSEILKNNRDFRTYKKRQGRGALCASSAVYTSVNEQRSTPCNDEIDVFRKSSDSYYPTYPTSRLTSDPVLNTQIQKGEYLAKIGDCIACHTNVQAGKAPFSGGLPIDTPFGILYSSNITPDQATGIGRWTAADFVRALKHGRGPHGENYFPVFPYLYFSKITDQDAQALYTYFMHLPAVHEKNHDLTFPFNIPGARWMMWGWNLLFFSPHDDDVVYDARHSPLWNRGKYIVDGLGHCGMCHTPLNIFGAPKKQYDLTGGFIDGYWAPNITKDGLHQASLQQIVDVFAKGQLINQAGTVHGPMAEVNHNSLQYLIDEDRLAIASYLKTVMRKAWLGVPPSQAAPNLKRGKEVYRSACETCHQAGIMSAPRIGDGANWFYRLQYTGLTGLYQHTIRGFNSMPPQGACVTCSDNDLMAAVDYILHSALSRSQWETMATNRVRQLPFHGKTIYRAHCAVCHDAGEQGAPKLGDKPVWNRLVQQNVDVLLSKVQSDTTHPPHGGCASCTTGELLEAIKYILSQSTTTGNYTLW